ncbi:hypothetical protein JN27_14630 [Massilia sp. BSC265]|nr:hypothetical protein JN27_14630 [Massilia sp. BSC265]
MNGTGQCNGPRWGARPTCGTKPGWPRRWLWGRIADWFGVRVAGFSGTVQPLESALANDHALWRDIAGRHGLVEADTGESFFDLFAHLRAARLIP